MKTCPKCMMRYPNAARFCFVDGADLELLKDARVGSTLVGRYLIEEVIGEGGMATVYRAKHKLVERHCAIKIMNPLLATDTVVRERFRREAKNASKLAHPNIVEIFDQGDTEDGTAYIAMELLEGHSLAELIAKAGTPGAPGDPRARAVGGPLPLPQALGIMIQIARGIARAHDLDVVHRDLKPENIFICRQANGVGDLVKILDFGIAKSRHDSRLTGAGELFGTPQYMAPERIERGEAGPSVDLYALGVIFWETLTGRLPFDAPDVAMFFVKHLHATPGSTRTSNPSVPEALDRLVQSLLAKDPKARPVDAHRVHQDLRAIATSLDIAIPSEDDIGAPEATVHVLPSSRSDPWARRTKMIERVLAAAYGGRPPEDVSRQQQQLKELVARVHAAYEACLGEQKKLGELDGRGREGRTRFGYAVDALGVDASRARDDVRVARAMAALAGDEVKQAKTRYAAAHDEILAWEGRSAFQEPYADLSAAYRAAASAMDAWLVARDEERKAVTACEAEDKKLRDLEFQIRELRSALAAHEATVEGEIAKIEKAIFGRTREAEELEDEALAVAKRMCDQLSARPEAKQEIAGLVRELEGEAAA